MTHRRPILRRVLTTLFLAAALTGFFVQGWPGIFLFPLALLLTAVAPFIGWHILDLVITYERHTTHVSHRRARISRLSTDQLQAIAATPGHPDFGFALVTLHRRGIDAKPSKPALLEMLLSPDPATRGRGMSFLSAFYPDIRLPAGSSSQDPPEVWRNRLPAPTTPS